MKHYLVFIGLLLGKISLVTAGERFVCAGALTATPLEDEARAAKPAQVRHEGTRNAVVVFAQFADEEPVPVPEWAVDIFDPQKPGSFSHFYDTMSFGVLQVRGEVASRRYVSAQPAAAYLSDEPTQPGDFGRFVREILEQADPDVDFSRFDNDGPDSLPDSGDDDGFVDAVFINLRSAPVSFLFKEATGIASLGFEEPFVTDDVGTSGKSIRISTAQGTVYRGRTLAEGVGSMCHEYGHLLGLFDLYDIEFLQKTNAPPEEDSAGIGAWGLMGRGTLGWHGNDGPNGLCAFSRTRLGWSEVVEVMQERQEIRLRGVESGGRIYRVPLTGSEYFMIEHRRQEGSYYDRHIPGQGLLIWHVYRGFPGPNQPPQYVIDVECADGNWQDSGYPEGQVPDPRDGRDNLDFWAHDGEYARAHAGNLGDATDPFDGVRFRAFTPETNPSSFGHGSDLSVRVEEIRLEGKWAIAQVQTVPLLIDLSEVQLLDEDKDSVAVAGENISLSMKLTNRGGLNAVDLRVRLVTEDPHVEIVHEEVEFDDLGIGRETFAPKGNFPSLRFTDDFVGTHTARFALHIYANEGLVDVRELTVTGVSPRQHVREVVVVDPLGNGDGMAQPGEFVRVEPILEVERPELMRVFEFLLRPLQEGVIEMSGPSIDFDLSTRPVRPRQAPEFLIPSTVEPGSRSDFEFQVRSGFGEWRDTLSVVLQAGLDRTPPRVGDLRTHSVGGGVRFMLPETQVLDGSEVRKVEVAIYAATDTSRLATVPLTWRDNRYEGMWEADEPDTYLLRPSAEDAYGNRGEGVIQAFYVTGEDVIADSERNSGPWRRVELPGEGGISAITDLFMAPNHPEVMYASSSQTGVWRSANGSLSWERTGMMVGMEILIDAQDPFTLYTAGLRPQKSRDGGVTWSVLAHPDIFLLAADPIVPGRLFGWQNGSTRLMISEDGADSWQETKADSGPWVEGHPTNPKMVYAGQPYHFDPIVNERVPGFICHSEDGGRTWVRHDLNQVFGNFVLDPHNPVGVYATVETAFWYSPDSGASWQALSNLAIEYGQVELVIHPREPGRLMAWNRWAVREPRCWISRDGGWNWEKVEIPEGVRLDRVALHPLDPDQVFAVVSGSKENVPSPLLRSHDVGATWEKVVFPMQGSQTGTVFFDPKNRRYIGASRAYNEGEVFLGIYMSEDGGLTWKWRDTEQNRWYGSASLGALDVLYIDPFEPNQMLIQIGWDIMRSEDGGRNWNRIDLNRDIYSTSIYTYIQADSESPGVYYLGLLGVYRSGDFGKTWEKRSEGLPKGRFRNRIYEEPIGGLALNSQNTDILFAAIRDTVWESRDAGLNWQYAGHIGGEESIRALAVHPLKPKELYAATVKELYASKDQGQNWALVVAFERTGKSYESQLHIRFAPGDPERFYLVTGLELLETQDGGKSWQSIGKNLAGYPWFNDVAVDPSDPDGVYAATPWGMYRLERNEGSTIVEGQQDLPAAFSLQQNYPNPFNSSTVIRFSLSKSTEAKLTIYNLAGQKVATRVNEVCPAGGHTVRWDGRDDAGRTLASGVYLYRLRAGEHVQTRKLLLLR